MDISIQERLFREIQRNDAVRIFASTCSSAEKLFKKGVIHEGLFYRIRQLRLQIPPLRERLEDIDELVRMTIASLNSQYGKQIRGDTGGSCRAARRA